MKQLGNDFLLAVSYFSRLPVAGLVTFSSTGLERAGAWLPWIGWLAAAMMAAVLWTAGIFFPLSVAVALAMLAGVLFTGAFHEDGLADTGDGFGPVGDRDKALAAMKDSRLGVFGLLTLLSVLLLKFLALSHAEDLQMALLMILVAQPLSRLPPVVVMASQPYVSQSASRARQVAANVPGWAWCVAFPGALIPLLIITTPAQAIGLLVGLVVLAVLFMGLCRRRFGGYTGDVLGALQQLSECLILLMLLALWSGSTP